eukprot:9077746-Ditylum_brightwellii.AAC.1
MVLSALPNGETNEFHPLAPSSRSKLKSKHPQLQRGNEIKGQRSIPQSHGRRNRKNDNKRDI